MNVNQQIRRLKHFLQTHLLQTLSSRRLRLWGIAIAAFLGVIFYGVVVLSQQPVTISFLVSALEAEQFQPLVEQFESENPDIRIQIAPAPNASDAVEGLYTSSFLLGDSPYDLVLADITWIPKFAAANWLLPLSDQISEEELSAFLPADIEGSRYEGELYRVPMRSDVGVLYYRTDLLEEAGLEPPDTFEELIEVSQQLKQGDIDWGYVWQGAQYEGLSADFVEVLAGFGGFWVNPETQEVGLDQPEAIAAAEFLRNTVTERVSPPGVTNYQEVETLRVFQNGNSAFMRNWPYAFPEVNQEGSPINGKVGIRPMVSSAEGEGGACLGGWGFGISASSPHPEEAWRVIEFMTSEEAQKLFVMEYGYVPSRVNLFTDPEIVGRYGHYPQLLEIAEQAVLRPPVPQYTQVSDILQRYLSSAISGQISPERAMERAAGETRRLLGRYNNNA
ncbi:ABC transporter substrate-binding protein [Leptolyngbya sp. FACHB-671]|uniref:ABC transporter substrate-binding protein n=1 Tax=Leptolyngbya sp. FACHB-671 TaxID=2692812 RepID=UPI00168A31CF|nr:ABC transporter substrate-binding protein [Leptolyngbya sp. FACHB-671]MBD2069212.1 ABC transporter substrate-binding protein [Leptolyngbya sp. FACHB-671]